LTSAESAFPFGFRSGPELVETAINRFAVNRSPFRAGMNRAFSAEAIRDPNLAAAS